MNTNENKSSNELEALRSELQRTRGLLDAALDRLKAQEEQVSGAWEVLAVLWRGHELAEKADAKRDPEQTVSEEENEFFFRRMAVGLKHDDKIKQVFALMKAAHK